MKINKFNETKELPKITAEELIAFGDAQRIINKYQHLLPGLAEKYVKFWKDKINPDIEELSIDVYVQADKNRIQIEIEDIDYPNIFDTVYVPIDEFVEFCNNYETYKTSKKYNL